MSGEHRVTFVLAVGPLAPTVKCRKKVAHLNVNQKEPNERGGFDQKLGQWELPWEIIGAMRAWPGRKSTPKRPDVCTRSKMGAKPLETEQLACGEHLDRHSLNVVRLLIQKFYYNDVIAFTRGELSEPTWTGLTFGLHSFAQCDSVRGDTIYSYCLITLQKKTSLGVWAGKC
jgi:hypothetical protein